MLCVAAPRHISEAAPPQEQASSESVPSTDGMDEPLLKQENGGGSGGARAGTSWWGAFWLSFTLVGGIVWSVGNAIWQLTAGDDA